MIERMVGVESSFYRECGVLSADLSRPDWKPFMVTEASYNSAMELPKLWALIEADLTRARSMLPSSAADPTIREFGGFLDHSELELACDMLEHYGEHNVVSAEFWLALRDAATNMQLADRAGQYEKHAKSLPH
jgi:hypothetical protein